MADCFILRRGGGGSGGLNFEVVGGTTQPTSPKENTIWVNTSTAITSWVFSTEQPTSPASGMVWLATSNTSASEFNALKKNDLRVYPAYIKQYVNGSWVVKDAEIYQNSSWKRLWDGTIYDAGNMYTSITGGWGRPHPDNKVTGSFSSTDQYIMVSASASSESSTYTTNSMIDLTNAKKLTAVVELSEANSNRGRLLVISESKDFVAEAYTNPQLSGKQTLEIDVTSLSGKYYVGFGVWFLENATRTIKMYSAKIVW